MSPSVRHVLVLGVVLAPELLAQDSPPAAKNPAPAHPHSHGAVVTLDQFVTSAAPFARNQVDLAQATTVLEGRSLLLKQQATIGETLAQETGISATAFGPGASRPIIRGLAGDRIRLLENGLGTLDASVTSPDHAVSVEPFLVERIEVLRGPASLLYGSNAVGGAVNVITHRIETELPTERVRGAAELRGGSAADEFARGGVLDLAFPTGTDQALVLHLDGFRREAEDLRIPGYASSARLRAAEAEEAAEHGEEPPDEPAGRLPNSALDVTSGSVGLSFVGRDFHLGASYSGFETRYGVPGHAHGHDHEDEEEAEGADAEHADEAGGVSIDLRQRRTDLQGEWRLHGGLLEAVRVKFGHARYRHSELEPDGAVGTAFTNRGFDGRLELLHGGAPGLQGAWGLHATRSNFTATGEEAFVPSSVTDTQALFVFEEVQRGAVTWQFGGRVERTRLSAAGATRQDDEFSGSAGAVWNLDARHALAVSLAHTSRAPNAEELFADGSHLGTQSYQLGESTLGAERSLGVDVSLRRRQGFVTGAVTLFANRFHGFIFEEPTGLQAFEHDGAWEFLDPEDEHAGEHEEEGLPLYRTVQRDARFWGAEIETLWHLHERADWQLDLRVAADLTRGRADGRNLPRIPAARATVGLLWANPQWAAGVESQFVQAQKRTAPYETSTDSYTWVTAHVTRSFVFGHRRAEFFLRGSNLANEEARPHTSYVKELAPLARRSVTAGVRFTF